jgi:hypothetical protein
LRNYPEPSEYIAMPLKHFRRLSVFLVVGSVHLFGQTSESPPELLNSASPFIVQSILQSLGVEFTESAKDDKENTATYTLKLDGQTVNLIVGKSDLQLSFTLPVAAQLGRINLWNVQHRFARAYLDSDGMPRLDADLNTGNGGRS